MRPGESYQQTTQYTQTQRAPLPNTMHKTCLHAHLCCLPTHLEIWSHINNWQWSYYDMYPKMLLSIHKYLEPAGSFMRNLFVIYLALTVRHFHSVYKEECLTSLPGFPNFSSMFPNILPILSISTLRSSNTSLLFSVWEPVISSFLWYSTTGLSRLKRIHKVPSPLPLFHCCHGCSQRLLPLHLSHPFDFFKQIHARYLSLWQCDLTVDHTMYDVKHASSLN